MYQVGSAMDLMGLILDCMSPVECIGSGENMNPLGLDHMASRIDCMGQTMEHIGLVKHMGDGLGLPWGSFQSLAFR